MTNAGEEKTSPKRLPWGGNILNQKVKFLSTPSKDSLQEKKKRNFSPSYDVTQLLTRPRILS